MTLKRRLAVLIIAGLVGACSDPKPSANLTYARLYQEAPTFNIEFNSDQYVEGFYAKNRHQKVIRKLLMCALGDDHDFDIKHTIRYVFEGSLELQGTSKVEEKIIYRYLSRGDFYEYSPQRTEMTLLRGQALTDVLGTTRSVPCKVIMTVYVSSPYYSGTMSIPAKDIRTVANSPR